MANEYSFNEALDRVVSTIQERRLSFALMRLAKELCRRLRIPEGNALVTTLTPLPHVHSNEEAVYYWLESQFLEIDFESVEASVDPSEQMLRLKLDSIDGDIHERA